MPGIPGMGGDDVLPVESSRDPAAVGWGHTCSSTEASYWARFGCEPSLSLTPPGPRNPVAATLRWWLLPWSVPFLDTGCSRLCSATIAGSPAQHACLSSPDRSGWPLSLEGKTEIEPRAPLDRGGVRASLAVMRVRLTGEMISIPLDRDAGSLDRHRSAG